MMFSAGWMNGGDGFNSLMSIACVSGVLRFFHSLVFAHGTIIPLVFECAASGVARLIFSYSFSCRHTFGVGRWFLFLAG